MNSKIKLITEEFDKGNHEKCLNMIDGLDDDLKNDGAVLVFKMYCLSLLKRYDECLEVIDFMMANCHEDELLWIEKVKCHYFMGDEELAAQSVESLEGIVSTDNKAILVMIGHLFNLLDEPQKALKYCDDALKIDPSYREALFEKSSAAIKLEDDELLCEISEKLRGCSDGSVLSLTPVFLLKLFSKDYRGAFNLIEEDFNGNIDKDTLELLRFALYTQMIEDLDVQLFLTDKMDLSLSVTLDLLLNYYENGVDNGEIEGVFYLII